MVDTRDLKSLDHCDCVSSSLTGGTIDINEINLKIS